MTASPRALAGALRDRARAAGFDAVGIAAARGLERDGATLERWLAGGLHAGMAWMQREPARRADPRALLPGCRSVVAVALNYWPGDPGPAAAADRARVARYAWGRDYHRVLGSKLRDLAAWLDAECGSTSRACVDTSPVLERGWAEAAGLGWIGKNANLLSRELGSWLLLGELLTTAQLDPDPGPGTDACGTCTACLEACPTGAIVEDGLVDARRCIAYWTIEHRGALPPEQRAGIGAWIFGCDVCQEVCPWNRRFARPAADPALRRRDDLHGLDAVEILRLDEATFRRRFSGTALMRAKWEGLRRNACVVIGNRARGEDLPALEDALTDADPVVRGHAAWAIGRLGGKAAHAALAQARNSERDPAVRGEIERALARPGAPARKPSENRSAQGPAPLDMG